MLVLFGERPPKDETHTYAEPARQNANHVRMGIGRTPGFLPCISVVKLIPAAAMDGNNAGDPRASYASQLRKRIDKRKRDSTFRWRASENVGCPSPETNETRV